MFELITLVVATTLLTYLGAGVFPYVMPVLAAFLSVIGSIILWRTKNLTVQMQAFAAILMTIFIIIMILPLPVNSPLLVGKNRSQQNALVNKAIQECKEKGLIKDTGTSFSLSRNRAGSIRALLLWITGIWTVVLAARLDETRKKQFLIFLSSLGFLTAFLGIIGQWIFPQGKSLWWVFPAAHGEPVACFVNRNHFAGFLAMLCPASICLAAEYISRKRHLVALYWTVTFGVIVIALIMAMSRGAWIAGGVSFLITAVLLALKYDNRTRLILACVLFFLLTAVFAIPSNQLRERAESMKDPISTASADMRFRTWNDALRIVRDYPLTGTGPNGFRMVFPQYRTDTMRKEFKHVENEYVQTFVEYGVLGTTLLLIALLAFLRPAVASLSAPEKLSSVQISALAGCSAAFTHAILDFSLRIPLYFIIFLTLLSFAAGRNVKIIHHTLPVPAWIPGIVSFAIVLLVSAAGYRNPEMDMPDYVQKAGTQELIKCLKWSPTSWHTWFHLGNAAIASGKPGTYELGEAFLSQGLEYDPNNYILTEQLCLVQLHLNDIPAALETYKRLKELRNWKKIPQLDRIIDEQKKSDGENI